MAHLSSIVTEKEFTDSQVYNHEKSAFSMMRSLTSTALGFAMLYTKFQPAVWNFIDAKLHAADMCFSTALRQDMAMAILFVVITTLIDAILDEPFNLYSTFVIEEKYGFNKTTAKTYVTDKIKGYAVGLVLLSVLIPVILSVVDYAGEHLVVSLSLVTFTFILLLQIIIPTFILPLFFKFTDLSEKHQDLEKMILEEAVKTGVPISQVKVIDGSKRSSHSNAFVTGFWRFRKVVLFDTLLDTQSNE